MTDRKNQFFFIFCTLAIFIYLALKSAFQSISHDEAATFFHYIHAENLLPWAAHGDANNHIVNSALAWSCYKIFGADLFWLRLPNLLSFILYAFCIYKTSLFLKNIFCRYFFQLAMLTAIFPLEFFSLCRGYGMSLGFLWGAIYFLILFFRTHRPLHSIYSWTLIAASVWANLSLLNTYLIVIIIHLFYLVAVLKCKKPLLYFSVLFPGIAFYLSAVLFAFQMKEQGLLYYGALDGFIEITVKTLSVYQFGIENNNFLYFLVAIILTAALINLFPKSNKLKNYFDFRTLSSLILLGNVVGALLMAHFLKVNFPEDRTGIYFIPLSITVFSFSVEFLAEKLRWMIYANLLLLVFPAYLLLNLDLNKTELWKDLYISEKLYREAEKIQNNSEAALTVSGYILHEMSWSYFNVKNNGKLSNIHPMDYPDLNADLLLIPSKDFDTLKTSMYELAYCQPFNAVSLYKRKKPVGKILYAGYPPIQAYGNAEFIGFFEDTIKNNYHNLLLSFDGNFNSETYPFRSQIVVDLRDMDGTLLAYDYIPLHWLKSKWKNEEKVFVRPIQSKGEYKVVVKAYLWNINKVNFSARVDSLKLFLEN